MPKPAARAILDGLRRCLSAKTWPSLLLALAFSVSAQEVTITRVGDCDWSCADTDFNRISCHQRQDKAIESCVNQAISMGSEYLILPAQYRVTVEAPTTVLLTWNAPNEPVDGYRIYIDNGSGWRVLGDTVRTTSSVPVNTGNYSFYVTSLRDGLESDPSNIASISK